MSLRTVRLPAHGRRRLQQCVVFCVLALSSSLSVAYDLQGRWTSTKTDGGGIARGDAITLTWSVVPDGEGYSRAGNSNLIDYLDDGWSVAAGDRTPDLTNRVWWDWMDRVYKQYTRVSGLNMVYEPEQFADGADTGVSGDIRIGGAIIDNQTGGILADNAFPNNGDMRIDTSRSNNGTPSFFHTNGPQWRNLLSHESGHGVGLSHTDISGANAVMETPLETSFWGLQFDDIYAFNRNYGDPFEKSGGNDSLATAVDLGRLQLESTLNMGNDANDSVVAEMDSDWLGIDGTSDEDWFAFEVTEPSSVTIILTPQGPTYTTQEQGANTDFSARSDLRFELHGPGRNGLELLTTINVGGAGELELLDSFPITDPSSYFVRVLGETDLNQFYRLELELSELTGIPGDVNQDGVLDSEDINAFVLGWQSITDGLTPTEAVMLGDLNRSGKTDLTDAIALRDALLGIGQSISIDELFSGVPEPSSLMLLLALLMPLAFRSQRNVTVYHSWNN